jgi:hypothetical protein
MGQRLKHVNGVEAMHEKAGGDTADTGGAVDGSVASAVLWGMMRGIE